LRENTPTPEMSVFLVASHYFTLSGSSMTNVPTSPKDLQIKEQNSFLLFLDYIFQTLSQNCQLLSDIHREIFVNIENFRSGKDMHLHKVISFRLSAPVGLNLTSKKRINFVQKTLRRASMTFAV